MNLAQIDGFLEVSKRFLNQPLDNATQKTSEDIQSQIPKTGKQKENNDKVKVENIEPFANKSPEPGQIELERILKGESRKAMRRYKRHANQKFNQYALSRSILTEHVKKKHMGTREFQCEHCDYSSKWSSAFMRHKSKHTGNQKLCQHCQYSCPTNHMLKKHLESKHSEVEYDCEQCDIKTRTRRMLIFHVKKCTMECGFIVSWAAT